jgi:hypothetical protein
MLKIAALLFNSIALLCYQLFFVGDVTLSQEMPSSADVGNEFTINVTINKGSNTGFAKLQQDLPEGFTALEGESKGGTFIFVNQTVKFIWMSIPSDESFTISYKIKVDAAAVGVQTLGGKFSFVTDNVKQVAEIPATSITIIGDGTMPEPIAEEIIVEEPVVLEVEPTLNGIRKLPGTKYNGEDFFVSITINKSNINGYAKLTEFLPDSLTATAVETNGAVFTFDEVENKAVFIWGELPPTNTFKVTYKVSIAPGVNGEKIIEGKFSFVDGESSLKYVLPKNFITINTPAVVVEEVVVEEEIVEEELVEEELTEEEILEEAVADVETEEVIEEELIEEEIAVVEETPEVPAAVIASNIPAPQASGSVSYKVQILALKKAKKIKVISKHLNVKEAIGLEMAQGYTKYTIGTHNAYKEARDKRETISKKIYMAGSFVTAYNEGRRITVQEALMISNQKWYR